MRKKFLQIASVSAVDDQRLPIMKNDFAGGINTRSLAGRIKDTQSVQIENFILDTANQLTKRKGSTLIGDDQGSSTVYALHDYQRQGYSDFLLMFEGDNLQASAAEGNWTEIKGNFTASQTDIGFIQGKESGLIPDDVVFINVGSNNWWRCHCDSTGSWTFEDLGNTTYSPPQSTVGAWYGNRVWILKNDLLYFSEAYPDSYAAKTVSITGDKGTFTGATGDKIKVTIDGTAYDNIDISGDTSTAEVASAINTATGGSQATTDANDYLVITSTTTGYASNVSIEDATNVGKITIENCDDAWNELVDADCSTSADSADKMVGDASAQFNVEAACAAGDIIATEVMTETDLSAYSKIRFWIKSSVTLEHGDLQLLLDDTAECASPVVIVDIPATEENVWTEHEVDMGDTSGATAIISIGLKQVTDNGTYTVRLDDIRGVIYGHTVIADLFTSAVETTDNGNTPFDRVTNSYRVPVGPERGIHPTRDTGMIVMGENAIWGLAPSTVPAVTDKPQPLITSHGVVSKQAWVSVGDDLYFFAQDGLRSLNRTIQDKLQMGVSYPISYQLQDEFEEIAWGYKERISLIYFENKIYITVPVSSTEFKVWVYYPVTQSFTIIDGWSPMCWATHKISGALRLYYGKLGDGVVYRADYGWRDEGTDTTTGTTIEGTWESRDEDFGQPLIDKIGGEIEVEAAAIGSAVTLTVSARKDGGAYSTLGTMTLTSEDAPTLPVDLPFNLTAEYVIREKFSLDSFQNFRTLQVKITESNENNSVLKLYGVNLVTFPTEYKNE